MKKVTLTAIAWRQDGKIDSVEIELTALKITDALEVFRFIYTVIKEKPEEYHITLQIKK